MQSLGRLRMVSLALTGARSNIFWIRNSRSQSCIRSTRARSNRPMTAVVSYHIHAGCTTLSWPSFSSHRRRRMWLLHSYWYLATARRPSFWQTWSPTPREANSYGCHHQPEPYNVNFCQGVRQATRSWSACSSYYHPQ
jgi:hypothetical protein